MSNRLKNLTVLNSLYCENAVSDKPRREIVLAQLFGNVSLASGVLTTVVFDEVIADAGGLLDTSTGIITIQEDGIYEVSASIDWLGIPLSAALTLNMGSFVDGQAGTFLKQNLTVAYPLTAGETIFVQAQQDSGNPLSLRGIRTRILCKKIQ